ncbi:LPS translocon maturation chaperone LptM [Denitratimonas tolerans]|jgi:predicted small lipoprotein YifL
MKIIPRILLLCLLVLAACACGNKGDLVRPTGSATSLSS